MARKRKPSRVREVEGTHRPDRHGDPALEPKGAFLKEDHPPPDWMNEEKIVAWRRVLRILVPRHLATDLDVDAIAAYCEDEVWLNEARAEVSEYGVVTQGGKGFVKNPAMTAINEIRKRQASFWAKFGLTPSDRTGMEIGIVEDAEMPSRPDD